MSCPHNRCSIVVRLIGTGVEAVIEEDADVVVIDVGNDIVNAIVNARFQFSTIIPPTHGIGDGGGGSWSNPSTFSCYWTSSIIIIVVAIEIVTVHDDHGHCQ